jgi:hypothetical protein
MSEQRERGGRKETSEIPDRGNLLKNVTHGMWRFVSAIADLIGL